MPVKVGHYTALFKRPRQFDYDDVKSRFVAAMGNRNLALAAHQKLEADGRIHRCDATNKQHGHGKDDGAYCLHLDSWPAGWFKNHTDGLGTTKWKYWSGGGPRLNAAQYAELKQKQRRASLLAQRAQHEAQSAAAAEAHAIWQEATPARYDPAKFAVHRYLWDKEIRPHGAREYERTLVIPLYAPSGDLVNLQFINRDGKRWHVKDARKLGCYYRLPGLKRDLGDTVVICASFSTAASIQEAIGFAVYVSFGDDNLMAVARMVADRQRQLGIAHIIVAGDDDWEVVGNPGRTKAIRVARAIGALVAIPRFRPRDEGTDFNDLARRYGRRELRIQLASASEPDEDNEEEVGNGRQVRRAGR